MSRKLWWMVALGFVSVISVSAQSGWGRSDVPYDGEVTFVRLRWTTGTFGVPVFQRGFNMWMHEFPRGEQNLMAVLDDVTTIAGKTDGSLILTLDDPNLFKYPIALMQEPGFWVMTDEEAEDLRAYLLKGGFVIFNDFETDQWANFEAQMKRVIPGALWIKLDQTHPIFESFLRVEQIDFPHPVNHHLYGFRPEYFGLFENNEPTGRLMAIANYNTNLAEYWQMAGTGFFPIEASNVGFRLGVNYMVYGLTH